MSRVVVAIETMDQNDNAPELDRVYATSVCDSSAPGQVCFCFLLEHLSIFTTLHTIKKKTIFSRHKFQEAIPVKNR